MASDTRSIKAISVNFTADISGFGKGLLKASNQVDKFYAGIAKTLANSPFGKATKSVVDFGKGFSALSKSAVAPLKPLVAGLANVGASAKAGLVDVAKLAGGVSALVTAGIAATAVFAKGGLKRIGELGDTSLQIGIAVDKLSELQFAATATGASAEDLNGFLKGLNSTIHETIGQAGPAADAFRELGTSADELSALSPDQAFAKIKAGFDALPLAANKATLAVKIGGEAGLKLFKLLGKSAEEFEALKQKSKDSGFTVSPEDLAKVQAANSAFAVIGMTIDGVVNRLTVALAPAIETVSNMFTDWFAKVDKNGSFFSTLIDAGVAGFARLADTIVGLGVTFQSVFADISKGFGDLLKNMSSMTVQVGIFIAKWTGNDAFAQIGIQMNNVANTVFDASEKLADGAKKAQVAFDKAKPSDTINKAYDDFRKANDKSAKAQAANTAATKAAATANLPLLDSIGKLKTAFANQIADAGLTAEQKQIAELRRAAGETRKQLVAQAGAIQAAMKKPGADLAALGQQAKDVNDKLAQADKAEKDINDLAKKGAEVREAGRRDSLAEELRESTKLPQQKLAEDQQRIAQLMSEGKITQQQGIMGLAQKAKESGLTDKPKLAGALDSKSIEGRSYLLSQMGHSENPVEIAKRGLAATGMTNQILGNIFGALERQQQPAQIGFR